MSATTTVTHSRSSAPDESRLDRETLNDYRLHLTAVTTQNEFLSSPEEAPLAAASVGNPENWPTDFRRIPPYRPVNRNLDMSERPFGWTPAGRVIVNMMMYGVAIQSVSDLVEATCDDASLKGNQGLVRAWESTGYRWYPQLTRWEIGGEW